MRHDANEWGRRPLTLEANYAERVAWYRRPIIMAAGAGLLIAIAAALTIGGGSSPGIDMTTTGAIDTQGAAQLEGL
ncbi:MAG: hypothetical protein ACTSWI_06600 [Alphaproteobacteria bacterium]